MLQLHFANSCCTTMNRLLIPSKYSLKYSFSPLLVTVKWTLSEVRLGLPEGSAWPFVAVLLTRLCCLLLRHPVHIMSISELLRETRRPVRAKISRNSAMR